jgi:SAM-dependent methyltransferase
MKEEKLIEEENLLFCDSVETEFSDDDFEFMSMSLAGYVLREINKNTNVLECGNITRGKLANALKNICGCNVDIVDFSKNLGMNDLEKIKHIDNLSYDHIIMFEMIEKFADINNAMLELFSKLKTGGEMVIGVANVNHMNVIYNMLRGRFDYSDKGVFHKENKHFFTAQSFQSWVRGLFEKHEIDIELTMVGRVESKDVIETGIDLNQQAINHTLMTLKSLYKITSRPRDIFTSHNVFTIKKV